MTYDAHKNNANMLILTINNLNYDHHVRMLSTSACWSLILEILGRELLDWNLTRWWLYKKLKNHQSPYNFSWRDPHRVTKWKVGGMTKVIKIHHLTTINVCSKCCADQSTVVCVEPFHKMWKLWGQGGGKPALLTLTLSGYIHICHAHITIFALHYWNHTSPQTHCDSYSV